jgi:hypothetical protein
VTPAVTPVGDHPIARVEWWVDGKPVAEAKSGVPIPWDTTGTPDGPVEVRAVAVEEGAIETRSFASAVVVVANGTGAPTITGAPKAGYDDVLSLSGRTGGSKDVALLAGGLPIPDAKVVVTGDGWKATVPARALGIGVTALHVRGTRPDGTWARSAVLEIAVSPPAATKPSKSGAKRAGWRVEPKGGGTSGDFVLADLGGLGRPSVGTDLAAKAKGATSFSVSGEFDVASDELCQLVVRAAGEVEVEVDGRDVVPTSKGGIDRLRYGLARLGKGTHSLRLRYAPSGAPDLGVTLSGDVVAMPVAGRH